jgi:hypothetical protein
MGFEMFGKGATEFLATLATGLYLSVALLLGFTNIPLMGNNGVIMIAGTVPGAFLLGFVSYLLGSILRSIRVKRADWINSYYNYSFPYPAVLNSTLESLRQMAGPAGITLPPRIVGPLPDNLPMAVFDFWKNTIRQKSPAGIAYIESLEIRVRYLAGMQWASVVGVLAGIGAFVQSKGPWLLFLSLLLIPAICYALYRARREEANETLLSYLTSV